MPSSRWIAALLVLASVAASAERPPAPRPGGRDAAGQAAKADAGRATRLRIARAVLLDHFVLGVDAPKEWHQEVRQQNGARFDFVNCYLSAGVGHDEPWFFKYGFVENRLNDCAALGIGAWFTWYMLSQSAPADYKPGPAQAAPANAKNADTMRQYFACFARVMDACAKHPDLPIVVQIEPDEWCHLLISGGMDPAKATVMVGSCGLPELAGLPDDEYGYARALARLRDAHAPNVLLGCNPSGWDWRGSMTGAKMGATFKAMCGDEYDLAVFETGDRDKGAAGKAPPFGDQSGICETFPNHLEWIRQFHEASGYWVALWQVAIGNTVYATCDNSPGHRCDNLAQFILEGYPKNDGIARYVAAGCCGWMFNGGVDGCTACFDACKDGITNPKPIAGSEGKTAQFADDDGGFLRLGAAAYYQHPFPILAKAKPPRGGKDDAAKAKPADAPAPAKPRAKPTLADPSALAERIAQLRARVVEHLAGGAALSFTPSGMRDAAVVQSASDAALAVTMDAGRIDLAWARLTPADLAQLARATTRDDNADDHARAAFFSLLAGDGEGAETELRRAGDRADAVRAAFAAR